MMPWWCGLPIGLLSAWCLLLWNRRVAGCLADDPPDRLRKMHAAPMPLGGLALLPIAAVATAMAGRPWLCAAVIAAALIGDTDDRRKQRAGGLDWRLKALGLGVVALLVARDAGVEVASTTLLWALPFAFVVINATNFLDNTDGVCLALAGTGLLLAGGGDPTAALLGAAAFGVLPWNWPRPRLFVGDAGAYLLGALLAATGLAQRHTLPTLLAPVLVPLADFVQVVAMRLRLGVAPWRADRRHLTHIAQNLRVPRWLCAPLFGVVAAGAILAAQSSLSR